MPAATCPPVPVNSQGGWMKSRGCEKPQLGSHSSLSRDRSSGTVLAFPEWYYYYYYDSLNTHYQIFYLCPVFLIPQQDGYCLHVTDAATEAHRSIWRRLHRYHLIMTFSVIPCTLWGGTQEGLVVILRSHGWQISVHSQGFSPWNVTQEVWCSYELDYRGY